MCSMETAGHLVLGIASFKDNLVCLGLAAKSTSTLKLAGKWGLALFDELGCNQPFAKDTKLAMCAMVKPPMMREAPVGWTLRVDIFVPFLSSLDCVPTGAAKESLQAPISLPICLAEPPEHLPGLWNWKGDGGLLGWDGRWPGAAWGGQSEVASTLSKTWKCTHTHTHTPAPSRKKRRNARSLLHFRCLVGGLVLVCIQLTSRSPLASACASGDLPPSSWHIAAHASWPLVPS